MNNSHSKRGGAPVGFLSELPSVEAASVIYLRMWCNGPNGRDNVLEDFVACLGKSYGERTLRSFEQLCKLCSEHGRRPLLRHSIDCKCLGADESCFANFVATAADGAREDAMLIATLLVRPDMAPMMASVAAEVGLAFKRMGLGAPQAISHQFQPHTTLH